MPKSREAFEREPRPNAMGDGLEPRRLPGHAVDELNDRVRILSAGG